MKKFITPLGIVNAIIQIFFIRITRMVDTMQMNKTVNIGLFIGIIPFTGWNTPYKFLFNNPVKLWFIRTGK